MSAKASSTPEGEVRLLPSSLKLKVMIAKALATSFNRPPASAGIPDRAAMVLVQPIQLGRLAAYNRLCGFDLGNSVPATWLHVLTFPLQTFLMSRSDFPFSLPGTVHLANEMTQYRRVSTSEQLQLTVRPRNVLPHRKGVAFEFVGEAEADGELVWSGVTTYLATNKTLPGEPVRFARPDATEVEPSQQWQLPADLGRRYAAVSGDSNPIHTNLVSARIFGFPRPIIHGMWTHARALAALGPRVAESFTVNVSFTKPILLPSAVRFAAQPDADGWRFTVWNEQADSAHLLGELRPAK